MHRKHSPKSRSQRARALSAAQMSLAEHLERRLNFGWDAGFDPPDCDCDGGGGGGGGGGGEFPCECNSSEDPVNYVTGTPKLSSTDLASDAFGSWGIRRSYSTRVDDTEFLYKSRFGNEWALSGLPSLGDGHNSYGEFFVVDNGGTNRRFFRESTLLSDIVTGDRLVASPVTGESYVYHSGDGTRFHFATLSNAVGRILKIEDPYGNETNVTYNGEQIDKVERTRSGDSLNGERYVFTHRTGDFSAWISSITLERKDPADGSWDPVRKATYDYWDSTFDNALKSVTTLDANDAIIDVQHYRYADEKSTETRGITQVFGPEAFRRLDLAMKDAGESGGLDPDVDDSESKPYADNVFEYQFDVNGVWKEIAKGAGCSCGGNGGAGVYVYERETVGSASLTEFNKRVFKTTESFYGNDADVYAKPPLWTRYIYSNAAKQPVLKVFDDGANEWSTGFRYNMAGELLFIAQPSAISASRSAMESTASGNGGDLLGYNTTTGGYTNLHDSQGLINWIGYYGNETADTSSVGAVMDYKAFDAVMRGDLSGVRQAYTLNHGFETTTATVEVTGAQQPFSVGDIAYLYGATEKAFNGAFKITAINTVNDNSFSFTVAQSAPTTTTGTIYFFKPQLTTLTEYIRRDVGTDRIYVRSVEKEYRGSAAQTDSVTTAYAYEWHTGSFQYKQRQTTYPTLGTSENGPSVGDVETEVFDEVGREIFFKDGDGRIHYTEYYDADDTTPGAAMTGAVMKSITDLDTDATTDYLEGLLPSGWSSPDGLHLKSEFESDLLGRITKELDPNDNTTHFVYDDIHEGGINATGDDGHETWVFPGWNSSTSTTAAPVRVIREDELIRNVEVAPSEFEDQAFSYTDTIEVTKSSAWSATSGVPTAAEAVSSLTLRGLNRNYRNQGGQVVDADRYVHFNGATYSASTEFGTSSGTNPNRYRDSFWYDKQGRLERTKLATGTITRSLHDVHGRMISEWVGLDDIPSSGAWSPTNGDGTDMRMVVEREYDEGGVGDGNLTRERTFPTAAVNPRLVQNSYDWRNRLTVGKAGVGGKQVDRLTPSSVIEPGDKFIVTIFDETGASASVTVSATSSTISDLTAALTTAINGSSNPLFTAIGAADGTSYVTITADSNDVAFHVVVTTTESNDFQVFDEQRFVRTAQPVTLSEGTTVNRLLAYVEYDNLGRPRFTELYDADAVSITSTDGVPDRPSSSLRRSKDELVYDAQGRVFRERMFSVDPSTGSVSTFALNTDYFFDKRGNVIKMREPGNLVTKWTYDGAGRATKEYKTDGGGDPTPGSSGAWDAADDVTDDVVLEQREWVHDKNGNLVHEKLRQRFHDATSTQTGELGNITSSGSTAKARVSHLAWYYDSVDRMIKEVNVGTKGGDDTYSPPATAADTLNNRDDLTLVTDHVYDAAGWLEKVIDPKGIEDRRSYDVLGRLTQIIEAYDNGVMETSGGEADDRTTQYTYDGSDHVVTMKALLPGSDHQTTEYVYARPSGANGSDIWSNDLLWNVKYPDLSTGSPSDSQKETYTFNALGEHKTSTDRNGTTHTYTYDVLGRIRFDVANPVGSGVDTATRTLGFDYDSAGRPLNFKSYSSTDINSLGTPLTTVKREYNGLGQITREHQAHSGDVTTGTPQVQYIYSTMPSGANYSRQTRLIYPGSKAIEYAYSAGVDATISRLSKLQEIWDSVEIGGELGFGGDEPSGGGQTNNFNEQYTIDIETFSYLGLNTVVKRGRPQSGVDLSYIQQSGDTLYGTSGGDQYRGLDRFGRIVDQFWVKTSNSTAIDRFQYGYDRNSNRTYKWNLTSGGATHSELYGASLGSLSTAYDNLNRLQQFARGQFTDSDANKVPDQFSNGGRGQKWTLEALGNWDNLEKSTNGGSSWTADQDRSHNRQNQITSDGTSTFTYDANGNLTYDGTQRMKYDAWNRLAAVSTDGDTVFGEAGEPTYKYDAMNRRIAETVGSETTDLYYSAGWQVMEERVNGTVKRRNVWSPVYIDALVLRDRDANGSAETEYQQNAYMEERLYVQQDANFNVTSLVGQDSGLTAWGVVERYEYDPYGTPTVMHGGSGFDKDGSVTEWATDSGGSDVAMLYGHQGGRRDSASGKVHFRNRDLDTVLGRWVQQDPLDTEDGMNLYQHVLSNPVRWIDPYGLKSVAPPSTQPTSQPAMTPAEELQDLVDASNEWNKTSPPWADGNQCMDQSVALMVALRERRPKHWEVTTDGGFNGIPRWGYHHVVMLMPKPKPQPGDKNAPTPKFIDPFKPKGAVGTTVKVGEGRDFRLSYPFDCGCCTNHPYPLAGE